MKNLIQSILILIAVLMSTTGAEEVIYAQVGDTVTLKRSDIIVKEHYVYWYFGRNDGSPLYWRNPLRRKGTSEGLEAKWQDRLSMSDDSLIIKNIQQENFGTFFCKVTGKEITTYKVLKLSVSLNPTSPLLPGEPLTLDCDVETPQGHKPKIYWLNPRGGRVDGTRGASGGKLTVSATGQDNGQWTCVVTNDQKENNATISVLVVDLSPAPSHPQYTSKSSPLVIPCSILPHISWKEINAKRVKGVHWHFSPKPSSNLIALESQRLFSLSLKDPQTWIVDRRQTEDRRLRPSSKLNQGILSLTRNRGVEEDRGNYTCSLEFDNGVILNRTIQVDVLEIISSSGTELIFGQRVNLTCSTGRVLHSDVTLKWIPPQPSSLMSLISDHHPAHLTIPEVGKGDGGKWVCELWYEKTRLTSATITLKIASKFSVWMLVTICGAAVIVILICILVVILCRRRKRKMRHLRHRLCKCKNPKPKGFYRT